MKQIIAKVILPFKELYYLVFLEGNNKHKLKKNYLLLKP